MTSICDTCPVQRTACMNVCNMRMVEIRGLLNPEYPTAKRALESAEYEYSYFAHRIERAHYKREYAFHLMTDGKTRY